MAPRVSESLRQYSLNPKSLFQPDLRCNGGGGDARHIYKRCVFLSPTLPLSLLSPPYQLPSFIWFEGISTSSKPVLNLLKYKTFLFCQTKHINVISRDVNIISHAPVNILDTIVGVFLPFILIHACFCGFYYRNIHKWNTENNAISNKI